MQEYHTLFGLRWLCRKFEITPSTYYYFMNHKKAERKVIKEKTLKSIEEVYHESQGIPGYRMVKILLEKKEIYISKTTAHHYMNKELKLYSIVKRKNGNYKKGKANKVFPNLLNQNFKAKQKNMIWCTDFTYLFLTDGSKRYNSSIIDLYDRSVIASVNSKEITSELAIQTLKKAFNEYCESVHIQQSMSKAGYPYDNAPMERYFNSLKNELIYHHYYHNDKELNEAVNDYAYGWYNHVRPHAYNGYLTPFEARYAVA